MSQGEDYYQETDPTEISQGDYDYEEVQRLSTKLSVGAQKAEFLFSSPSIYKVPKVLRGKNESAYTPRLIAIGPLYRNDDHLQTPMQHLKLSYANELLCRLTKGMESQQAEQKKITVLGECMAEMKTSLDDAKKRYAEEVTLDVEMMLVDGCFILEYLYRSYLYYHNYEVPEPQDPIFDNGLTWVTIQHDLVLLENQIPFLVLERLFGLTVARIPNNPLKNLSLTDYVFLPFVDKVMRPVKGKSTNSGRTKTSCSLRDCILLVLGNKINNSKPGENVPSEEVVSWQEKVPIPGDCKHILHRMRHACLPRDQCGKGKFISEIMPSASELIYAGVQFVPGTGNDLFKIKFTEPEGPFRWFRSARFEIPPITLQIPMEPLFRNFIAFEQCCPGISEHFTSYARLMDMLVNSDTDVQVHEKAGIMENWLSASKNVTDLFNKLANETFILEFYFADTCNKATRYSKRFWPKNMAYLRRQYFASPWKFIAFCLGFVYFGLTIAQLVVSIYLH